MLGNFGHLTRNHAEVIVSYPVPYVQPNQRNQQDNCWPRVLTYNNEDAKHCDVHGNHNAHKKWEININISLISGCLHKFKYKGIKINTNIYHIEYCLS